LHIIESLDHHQNGEYSCGVSDTPVTDDHPSNVSIQVGIATAAVELHSLRGWLIWFDSYATGAMDGCNFVQA